MKSKWKYTEGDKGKLKDIINYLVNEREVWVDIEITYEGRNFREETILKTPGRWFKNKEMIEKFGPDYDVEIIGLTFGEIIVDVTTRIDGIWDEV